MKCDCVSQVNEALRESNAVLNTGLTARGKVRVLLPVMKIDSRIKKRLPALVASFCPFCGTAVDDALAEEVDRG